MVIGDDGPRERGRIYDIVEVPAGETKRWEVVGGETLENLLIDVTADGADAQIRASGTGWTIRNIGVRGRLEGGFFMNLQGSGRCEHMYLGDGNVEGVAGGGGWVNHYDSEGPFYFEQMHVAKLTNNGLYTAPTAEEPVAKTVYIKDSYFDSNNGSAFKIGSEVGTSVSENVTIRTDGDVTVGATGKIAPRALWALGKTGDNDNFAKGKLVDCDIQGEVQWQGSCELAVENTRHEGHWEHMSRTVGEPLPDPDLTPPAGVPMTPEAAAAGRSDESKKAANWCGQQETK